MRNRLRAFLSLVVLLGCFSITDAGAQQNTLTPAEKAQGWRMLFDGASLAGWVEKPGWVVADDAIHCTAEGKGDLRTTEQFDNFVLSLAFKIEAGGNSGVFLRWSDLRDWLNTSIEVQVFDSYGKQKPGRHDCAAIYDCVAPTRNACKPAGEWNTLVITCNDNRITVELNGVNTTEMDLDQWTKAGMNPDGTRNKFKYALKELPRRGYLFLQNHGNRVWYRDIKIRPLPATRPKQ